MLAVLCPGLHAGDETWSGSSGQHWSTSNSDKLWNNGGGENNAWVSGSNAIFVGGAGGAVDVRRQDVTVGDITFTSSSGEGWSILTTGANGLVLGGSSSSTANTTRISTAGVPVSIGVALSGGSANLVKAGIGTLTLSGASSYSGATTVSAGRLVINGSLGGTAIGVGGGASLGGTGSIGTTSLGMVTLASGRSDADRGALDLSDAAIGSLSFGNKTSATTVLGIGGTAGNSSILSFDVGASADCIVLGTNARLGIGAGGGLLRLTGLGHLSGTTQTLISSSTAAAGGALSGLLLDATSGNFSGCTLALQVSGNNLDLTETANAAPTTAYWKGSNDGLWDSFSGGNSNISNFATSSNGANAGGKVGAATDVIFNASAANSASTTLGEDMTIKTLAFGSNATAGVDIGGSNTLTIKPTSSATGVTVASGSGNHTISSPIELGANQTWTVTDAGQNLTASNQLGGGFGLTKAGAGTLTLTGASSYTGVTTVSGGTLTLTGTSGAIGGSSGVTIGGGGTLKLDNSLSNGTGRIGTAGVTMNGGTFAFVHAADSSSYAESAGALAINFGASSVSTDASGSGGSSVLKFAALGRVAGAGGVVNFGGGTGNPTATSNDNNLRLATAPALVNGIIGSWATVGETNWATYTAGSNASVAALTTYGQTVTRLSSGTKGIVNAAANNVQISEGSGTAAAITLVAGTTAINTLTNSATGNNLPLGGVTIDPADQTLRTGGILNASGASALTIGSGTRNGTLTANAAGGELMLYNYSVKNLTINSVIADNTSLSNLTKAGGGTVFLNGANTYAGVTTIDAGTVNVATLSNYGVAGSLGNRALGGEAVTLVGIYLEGGTLQYTGATAQSTDRNLRVGLNGGTLDASGGAGASMNFTHSTTNVDPWANPGSRALTLTGTNSDNNTFAINLQEYNDGNGSHSSLVKSGAGTWDLTNSHNSDPQTNSYLTFGGYSGGTTVSGGTLGFVNGAIGGGVLDITGNATLRWDAGNTQDITTGSGAGVARSVMIEDGVTATFNTNGNQVTLNNALAVGPLKTGALTKDGAGTLTLSSANTYRGKTTVNGGTLVIDGDERLASGAVSVSGKLAGTGTVGGATTINAGGTLAPGEMGAVGTLNFASSLHFASGSIFEWDLSANSVSTGFDMVGGGGEVSVDTGSTVFKIVFGAGVTMSDAFWSAPYTTHTWAMSAIFGDGFSGAFASVDTGSYPVNSRGRFTISGTNLLYTTLPEPTTALAGLLLGAGLLRRRRGDTLVPPERRTGPPLPMVSQ